VIRRHEAIPGEVQAFTRARVVDEFVAVGLVRLPVDLLTVLGAVVGPLTLANLDSSDISAYPTDVWLVNSVHQHFLSIYLKL
jgi:hypothetical protein